MSLTDNKDEPSATDELSGMADQISDFLFQLAKESERASVVMGVAQIDLALEKALKRLMNPNPGGQDDLFDQERPLSSLAAKTALAYRLGLIDSDFEHALHMMRKIRNDFAHSPQTEHLSQPRHQSRLKEVLQAVKSVEAFKRAEALFTKAIKQADLVHFCAAVAVLLFQLEWSILENNRINVNYVATLAR
jgi:hypothetical protein